MYYLTCGRCYIIILNLPIVASTKQKVLLFLDGSVLSSQGIAIENPP
jgi:hypothetical protein